ncbi:MAG: 50S ribosomal protein L19 [Spirochaetaceae bacterium]|nr:50S ribosomal protein L19 [Spirochaetaceae bacterium]
MDLIKSIEAKQIKENAENFHIGDTIKVFFKIIEGATERVQIFEGACIAKSNTGIRKAFTVRKLSYGVGVERIFPLHSPRIQKIEVVRPGKVRRAKLYYLRGRVGKAVKIKELIRKKADKVNA